MKRAFRIFKANIKIFLGVALAVVSGKYSGSKRYLQSVKDIHKGERCFIIGNGPSLTVSDLEKLKGEYTFASNRIYTLFSETDWRPTYYVAFDSILAKENGGIGVLNDFDCEMKFSRLENYLAFRNLKKPVCFVKTKGSREYLESPAFSTDAVKHIFTIASITYAMFQLAVHMGFNEIYLIGMDNRYAFTRNRDGTVTENKNVLSHFEGDIEKAKKTAAATWEFDVAYNFAESFSKENNFDIYNATRGGYLEVFRRVDFDSLFN